MLLRSNGDTDDRVPHYMPVLRTATNGDAVLVVLAFGPDLPEMHNRRVLVYCLNDHFGREVVTNARSRRATPPRVLTRELFSYGLQFR